jgi:hypothetical protein
MNNIRDPIIRMATRIPFLCGFKWTKDDFFIGGFFFINLIITILLQKKKVGIPTLAINNYLKKLMLR